MNLILQKDLNRTFQSHKTTFTQTVLRIRIRDPVLFDPWIRDPE
jgi:hypothetical protein